MLFLNKYRIESARLPTWNYGDVALYFITICTKEKQPLFGRIVDRTMDLNVIGTIVDEEWKKVALLRPDMNLSLHEFVVMPNHFHAILEIGLNEYNKNANAGTLKANQFIQPSKHLPSIIGGFKGAVTSKARPFNPDFGWQSRYHDHIIRSEAEYNKISEYIENNVLNWAEDRFHI